MNPICIPKIIGIVGSRRRNTQEDYYKLEQLLFNEIYNTGDWFVSGGCPTGADHMAEEIAEEYAIPMIIHYADWDKHGRAAGHIRNLDIARDCTMLVALPAPDRTGGTESTIAEALRLRREVILI